MPKIKYFSEDEVRKFFDAVKTEKQIRDLLLFWLIYRYGLRISEAVWIELGDIKPSAKHPVEIEIKRLKGGQGRHYSVHPDDAKLLKSWLRTRGRLENSKGNPFLFITNKSGSSHMTDVLVKKLHQKYCERAGLPREKSTNPHAWRHSCAVALLMSGKDIYFTKNYLGHKSLQSTLVYLEIAPPEWGRLSKEAVLSAFNI